MGKFLSHECFKWSPNCILKIWGGWFAAFIQYLLKSLRTIMRALEQVHKTDEGDLIK